MAICNDMVLHRWQRAADNAALPVATIFGSTGSAFAAEGSYTAIPFDSDRWFLAASVLCEQAASASAARTAVLTPIVKTKEGLYFGLTPTTVTTSLFTATGKYQSPVAVWSLHGLHIASPYTGGTKTPSIMVKVTGLTGFSASATVYAGTY